MRGESPTVWVTDFGVMRVLTFSDPDGHSVELALWVGAGDPAALDMSKATDEEIIASRAAASNDQDSAEQTGRYAELGASPTEGPLGRREC